MINEIEVNDLESWLQEGAEDLQIIDVREHNEVAGGKIPEALHIPLVKLPYELHQIEDNKRVVFVCRSGARSAQACFFVQRYGNMTAYNLRGGMMAWYSQKRPAAQTGLN
jgi:rhodanese-related sulfurtransferase